MNSFNTLNISQDLIRGTERMNFSEMTEVQEKVIPIALTNCDVIAQAPTGTGKTMAFALPILNKIDVMIERVQAIIIAPTRELAVQISNNFKEVSYYKKDVKVVCVYGGEPIDIQIKALRRKPQIIVCTPGRLIDHLNRKTIHLDYVNTVVLDEADEMLNMGFKEDLDEILSRVSSNHQTMLFSATLSDDILRIAKNYLHQPEMVKVTKTQLTVSTVEQKYIECDNKDKVEVITRLIDVYGYKLTMIFCNTKRMVDEVTSSLLIRGFVAEALHGDMKQNQRDRVMQRFKSGQINILVASDVAARGLDIDDVDAVINYDIPTDDEYYVHRIGRTGRANKEGISITLITEDEKYRLREIMQYSKAMITKFEIPNLDNVVRARVDRVMNIALGKVINPSKYYNVVSEFVNCLDEENKNELLEGLLMMQIGDLNDLSEASRKQNRKSKYTRLFIGAGRKDGIKVGQLLDILSNAGGIQNADIDDVDVRDAFSFAEVPSSSVDQIIYFFATTKIKGKIIGVEVAKERKQGSSSRRSNRNQKGEHTQMRKSKDGYVEIDMKKYSSSRRRN